jgi:superfamily I DNA/RNA helicase
VEALLAKVRSLCESGYSPADLAILYRRKEKRDAATFDTLLKRLDDMGLRPYWVTQDMQTKTQYSASAPGIRIITALSSLGLEFKVVLLLWVEQFADCCNGDPETAAIARRQLYVAMTRAQDELHLFAGKYARLVGELRGCGEVDTRQIQNITYAQITPTSS